MAVHTVRVQSPKHLNATKCRLAQLLESNSQQVIEAPDGKKPLVCTELISVGGSVLRQWTKCECIESWLFSAKDGTERCAPELAGRNLYWQFRNMQVSRGRRDRSQRISWPVCCYRRCERRPCSPGSDRRRFR